MLGAVISGNLIVSAVRSWCTCVRVCVCVCVCVRVCVRVRESWLLLRPLTPSHLSSISSALLPSQSPDKTLHTKSLSDSSLSDTHTHTHTLRFEDVPPTCECVIGVETNTHAQVAVSPQCSLINEMAPSLPYGWTSQARGHKSVPAGEAEGHRPIFIGNLSPDDPDRESDMLVTRTQRLLSAFVRASLRVSLATEDN